MNLRFYYNFLSGYEKRIYRYIVECLKKRSEKIHVYIDMKTTQRILQLVYLDFPEFFYVDTSCMRFTANILETIIHVSYTKTEREISQIEKRMNFIADKILEQVNLKKMDNVQAVRYAHDFVIRNVLYSHDAVIDRTLYQEASSIVGVFQNHKAICRGISMAVKWVLDVIGICSGVIVGRLIDNETPRLKDYTGMDNQVNHAWNIVDVKDHWHLMDATMDLGSTKIPRFVSYDYFLRSGRVFRRYVQYIDLSVSCEREYSSYFYKNKSILVSYSQVEKYVQYCCKKRSQRIYFQLDFALDDRQLVENIIRRYVHGKFSFRYNDRLNIYDVCCLM